jgi:ribosomal 50S subunit-associated protein YjgA (DUF615 family)
MSRKKFQWSRDEDDTEGEVHFSDRTSRTELAREKERINVLARALVKMKGEKLTAMALSDSVAEVVAEGRRLRAKGGVRGGMKRQMLYVAAVLRGVEAEELARMYEALEHLK